MSLSLSSPQKFCFCLSFWVLLNIIVCGASKREFSVVRDSSDVENSFQSFFHDEGHTNNWAVLVDTSRFWFNYRHASNMLGIYQIIKKQGIPDDRIILMIADDIPCNPRNSFPGKMYHSASKPTNLYGEDVEVDYRGYEVTAQNFIRLMTDRVDSSVPLSKRLLTDDRSNILLYMTGHGGDGFLKFQDSEEVTSVDLADAIEQMWQKRRYHEILFMIDTCQANTMYSKIYSPNVIAIGSSNQGENSYSHESDSTVGVSLIDKFTFIVLESFRKDNKDRTIKEFYQMFNPGFLRSNPGFRYQDFHRPLNEVFVSDFFESSPGVELTLGHYDLSQAETVTESKVANTKSTSNVQNEDTILGELQGQIEQMVMDIGPGLITIFILTLATILAIRK